MEIENKRIKIEAWYENEKVYFILPKNKIVGTLWEVIDAKQVIKNDPM